MAKYSVGTFEAKIVDYGISETKAGDPAPFIYLEVAFPEGPAFMTWRGSFKEGKAREIALRTLIACGFRGSDPAILVDGAEGGALPVGAVIHAVIEEDTYDGKTYHKVAWINTPGSSSGAPKRADAAAAKAKLLKLNVAGDLARLRASSPAPTPALVGDEDTPF